MNKFIKRIREFWWNGLWNNTGLITRNCEEAENKRHFENPIFLDRYGYKVFSQNDEDGIIAEIFKRIGTTNKKFVEFGVGNGLECNTHFLLHQGWEGLWLEGSLKSCKKIKRLFKEPVVREQLTVCNAFITKDNINILIDKNLTYIDECLEIDLLSIDIDGNDYWIWQAIGCVKPRVVVIEYNAKFPPDFEWIMQYDAAHNWHEDDEHGASLKSLEILGRGLGYQLVATNLNGINAFFVKEDLARNKFPEPATAENLYHTFKPPKMMRYISGHPSVKYIGS
jgi:hypothetical protein